MVHRLSSSALSQVVKLLRRRQTIRPLQKRDRDRIAARIPYCLGATDLKVGKKIIGKVRDTYILDDKVVLVTTDRQSAFDRQLALVPYKGQVLNKVAAWWFKNTEHIIPNHVISVPHPNVTVGTKCTIFPVEVVVRGYMTGSTGTSVWTHYSKGAREYCGVKLPEGMVKSQKFPQPILTPTTKADDHDEPISPKDIVAKGLMTQEEWDYVGAKALELFTFGQKTALAVKQLPLPSRPGPLFRAHSLLLPRHTEWHALGGHEVRVWSRPQRNYRHRRRDAHAGQQSILDCLVVRGAHGEGE